MRTDTSVLTFSEEQLEELARTSHQPSENSEEQLSLSSFIEMLCTSRDYPDASTHVLLGPELLPARRQPVSGETQP